MDRLENIKIFYDLLDSFKIKQGGFFKLSESMKNNTIPHRGVYFFFDESEPRSDSGCGPRVVRVGTHGLTVGSKSSLHGRLAQHRGTVGTGGGNHRGSIFRLLVGQALISRDNFDVPTWGLKSDAGKASRKTGISLDVLRSVETPIEIHVSHIINKLPFILLDISDEPGPDSLRADIEKGSIALLSNFDKPQIDPPSSNWLGCYSNREKVRRSGLWNSDHVDKKVDMQFLDKLNKCLDYS
ncbi:hypothetical protein [Solidesulfovibrio alcoholivorans]|uniref:hypothetical protein n=1 Tax=Solidesulfovibrio alcoholivorans TaxID=81406 RepID=UPI0006950AA6|nr:hypothetical protein [Solidesulfovibrio alcoholivorans]